MTFLSPPDMVCSLSVLAVVLSLASSAPLDNREEIVDIIQSQNNLDNSIDVDERPSKQVEPSYLGFFCCVVWLSSMTVYDLPG